MYFNYTKYIPIVFQLQNTNYFYQGHKIQNTLDVFKIHVGLFQLYLYFNYSNTGYYSSTESPRDRTEKTWTNYYFNQNNLSAGSVAELGSDR